MANKNTRKTSRLSPTYSSVPDLFPTYSGLAIKFGERLVVVPAERFRFLSFEPGRVLPVPEDQVIRKLAYRVVAFAVRPAGLLGCQTLHRGVCGYKPLRRGVRRAQLRQQYFAQRASFVFWAKAGTAAATKE